MLLEVVAEPCADWDIGVLDALKMGAIWIMCLQKYLKARLNLVPFLKFNPCSDTVSHVHTSWIDYTCHLITLNRVANFKVAPRIWPSAGCTLDVFVERLNGGQAGPISVVGQADREKPHVVNVDVSFATIHHMSSYSSYIFSRFPWEISNDTLKGRCRWLWFSCSGSGWAATRSSNRSNWRLGDPMCLWLPR